MSVLFDRVLVQRSVRRDVERPVCARLAAIALAPELLVLESRCERSGHGEDTSFLVGKLDGHVVLESLQVPATDVRVDLPDARSVEALGVETEHLDGCHRTAVEPLDEHSGRTWVALGEGGDDLNGAHVDLDTVCRCAGH